MPAKIKILDTDLRGFSQIKSAGYSHDFFDLRKSAFICVKEVLVLVQSI
jgi:hypothetical protein